jgi:hypothetical protein
MGLWNSNTSRENEENSEQNKMNENNDACQRHHPEVGDLSLRLLRRGQFTVAAFKRADHPPGWNFLSIRLPGPLQYHARRTDVANHVAATFLNERKNRTGRPRSRGEADDE